MYVLISFDQKRALPLAKIRGDPDGTRNETRAAKNECGLRISISFKIFILWYGLCWWCLTSMGHSSKEGHQVLRFWRRTNIRCKAVQSSIFKSPSFEDIYWSFSDWFGHFHIIIMLWAILTLSRFCSFLYSDFQSWSCFKEAGLMLHDVDFK